MTISLEDRKFEDVTGSSIADNIKKQITGSSLFYFVKIGDKLFSVSGSQEYSEQINVMATAMSAIK